MNSAPKKTGPDESPDRLFIASLPWLSRAREPAEAEAEAEAVPGTYPSPESPSHPGTSASPEAAEAEEAEEAEEEAAASRSCR